MRATWFTAVWTLFTLGTVARSPRYLNPRLAEKLGVHYTNQQQKRGTAPPLNFRASETLVVQNANTTKFIVNGTAIPEVNFDIGESYAGNLPIPARNDNSSLYFWYFPTPNPAGKGDLTIWLNGGPGCSSLEGLLQENGPFLWNYGTYRPVQNVWSWVQLTNMLYVEQPVGTGFSQGKATERSEEEVAAHFVSWFKNFIETFGLQGKKIYIAGESYAGYYVPYIADAMFNATDKINMDVRGTMIYDPVINHDQIQMDLPAVAYVEQFNNLFRLNNTFMTVIKSKAQACGYYDYLNKSLAFPPPVPMPPPSGDEQCKGIWQTIKKAVSSVNPCFNMYQITTTCPLLWDVLGFPGSFEYLPAGTKLYFDRDDVKKAINAPPGVTWAECKPVLLNFQDQSKPSSFVVLPRVIEKSERTIIGAGSLDFIIMPTGILLSIQNMTWNGAQGFQKTPTEDFIVPHHRPHSLSTLSGSGVQGIAHTERGLTWVEIFLSGHMVPQYTPSSAYRHMEYLLGRIPSLNEDTPFTFQMNATRPTTYPVEGEDTEIHRLS